MAALRRCGPRSQPCVRQDRPFAFAHHEPNKFPNDFKAGHFFLFGFKESCFFFTEVMLLSRPVPSRPRGARVVTNVGRDAMDADAFAGRAAQSADCEVVWSWRPWAGAKFAEDDPQATVTMRSRTPGSNCVAVDRRSAGLKAGARRAPACGG